MKNCTFLQNFFQKVVYLISVDEMKIFGKLLIFALVTFFHQTTFLMVSCAVSCCLASPVLDKTESSG